MNRFTLAVALVVAIAASIGSIGCAAGVEDTQEDDVVEPQRNPPSQLRTGDQTDPLANVKGSVDDVRIDLRLPPKAPLPGTSE